MTGLRRIGLVATLVFVAAFAGVFVGRVVWPTPPRADSELHALLHHDLNLDPLQRARVEVLERDFAVRGKVLELELRSDNAKLAQAIEVEHGYGPGVVAAVDGSHDAMGRLQKLTLEHVFAMRALLRPEQAARFDQTVVKALTADPR